MAAQVTCSPSVVFSTSLNEVLSTTTVLGFPVTRTVTQTFRIPVSTVFQTCSDDSTSTTSTTTTTTDSTTTDSTTTTSSTTDSTTTDVTSTSTTTSSTSTTSDTSTITPPATITQTITSTSSASSSSTTLIGAGNTNHNNDSSFSTGAKIGVGVGAGVVAIIILGLLLRWLLGRKSRDRDDEILEKYRRESNLFSVDHGASTHYDPGQNGPSQGGGGFGGAATGAALGGAAAYGASKRRSRASQRDRRQDDYYAYNSSQLQPAPVQFLGPGRPSPDDVLAQDDDDFYGGSQQSSQNHNNNYYDPRYPPAPQLAYHYPPQQTSASGTPPGGRTPGGYAPEGIPYAGNQNQTRGQEDFLYTGAGPGHQQQQNGAPYIPASLRPAQSNKSLDGNGNMRRGNVPPPMPVPVPGAPQEDYAGQQPPPMKRGQTLFDGSKPTRNQQQTRSSTMPPVGSTNGGKAEETAKNDFEFPDFHRQTFHQGNIQDSINRPLSQDRLDQPLPPPPEDDSQVMKATGGRRGGEGRQNRRGSEDDGGQSVISVPNLRGYEKDVRGPLRVTNQSSEAYDGIM